MVDQGTPLLSIAIPAYGRPEELKFGLLRLISQVSGKHEDRVEIVISDDCTPGNGLDEIREIASHHQFVTFRRYPQNIGLERNLIACADDCRGEFLWLFGDDDFIEPEDGLDHVMALLNEGKHDFYVLNRTRRSFDLSRVISDNWMRLDVGSTREFAGLREFCLAHGFISVIGFISVNIFRRKPFAEVDATKYFGTMYPQLGAMVEAFHASPTLLVGRPLVCHRTQTAEEKKAALGKKQSESDFMADVQRRNAIYFSHPFVAMLDNLRRQGAFQASDILEIPENTVINGLLVDFLIQTVDLSHTLGTMPDPAVWERTEAFFAALPLNPTRRAIVDGIFSRITTKLAPSTHQARATNAMQPLTISVVTPSFNQAEFLAECLCSVRDQRYQAIEHLVFDPGSTDGSRDIAAGFPHATLFAEPDSGQSDAVNKGFRAAKGDIIAWVNSDDCFIGPGVFERVVARFMEPDAPDIVYGKGIFTDEHDRKLRDVYINKDPSSLHWRFQQEDGILQPALFMRRSVVERVGPLRNDRHFCMDYEYWIRCVKAGMKFAFVDEDFAKARYHNNNKTYGMRGKSYAEVCDMMKEHFGYVSYVWLKRYAEFLTEGHDGVLANADNTGIKDAAKLDEVYKDLMIAYNATHDAFEVLEAGASKKGFGDTLREMRRLGLGPAVPCKPIPLDQAAEPGCVAYTVGTRRWAFDAKWKASEIAKSHGFLRKRIAQRRNDTCVIVGNGPSLNETDLSLLKDADVIVSNNAFLSEDVMRHATYFTVVNYLVAEQSSHQINRLKGVEKVLPYWLSYCLNPGQDTCFVDAVGHAEFSRDMFKNMSWRHTVTFFNLHLAYGLGYRKVVLIGFDHNYKQPKGIAEQEVVQDFEEDVNHFHPSYFRGKKWQAADVDMMEEMYRLAKEAFEEDGRTIVNSTVGGKLELFERVPLATALRPDGAATMPGAKPLLGPFDRGEAAHWDETSAIARLFSSSLSGETMIDVGAHIGTALEPFLNDGWTVFAFEPDETNRGNLLKRLSGHRNWHKVVLDTRCVSDKTQRDLSFYKSDESTGISGLSAFHESHVEAQRVDTVTLTDFFGSQVPGSVDFLKIDTEGFDYFVLQGFPWSRLRPAVIECEFEDLKTVPLGYTFHDLAKFLVGKGYTVYVSEWHPVLRYGIRHDWNRLVRYPCELASDKGWGNLLAFREPIDESVLVRTVAETMQEDAAQKAKRLATAKENPGAAPTVPSATIFAMRDGKQRYYVLSADCFHRVSDRTWRYTRADALRYWQACFDMSGDTANSTFIGSIRLASNRPMTVSISLARSGSSGYEGTSTEISLLPGIAQSVNLRKLFARSHKTLKVQVEILDLHGASDADLTVEAVSVTETLSGIARRINEADLTLRTANRLFRDGDLATAMLLYLLLHRKATLKIYADNALMSARRIGVGPSLTVEELFEYVE